MNKVSLLGEHVRVWCCLMDPMMLDQTKVKSMILTEVNSTE